MIRLFDDVKKNGGLDEIKKNWNKPISNTHSSFESEEVTSWLLGRSDPATSRLLNRGVDKKDSQNHNDEVNHDG